MKIAVFYELYKGGARKAANELSKKLKTNHLVDLYYVDEKQEKSESQYYHSRYFFGFVAKKWIGRNWKVRLYKDTIELVKLYFLHWKIAQIIDSKYYDVVLIHPSQYTQAPFLLRFLRSKKIYYCEEPLRLVYDPLFVLKLRFQPKIIYEFVVRKIRKAIDKNNILHSNLILVNSFFSQKSIKKAYALPSKVCYLGVDTNFYKPAKVKRDIDILFINKQKDNQPDEMFEVIKQKLSHKYRIVELQNNKKWLTDESIKNHYQKAKIVLCLSRNEPFGLIPLEAGAAGCVVVALDEGGFKESIKNGKTGYLVEANALHIGKKIDKLLQNPQQLSKLAKNARALMIKEWTWELARERLDHHLEGLKKR